MMGGLSGTRKLQRVNGSFFKRRSPLIVGAELRGFPKIPNFSAYVDHLPHQYLSTSQVPTQHLSQSTAFPPATERTGNQLTLCYLFKYFSAAWFVLFKN